jgi:sporulation protein YlmC with PRC-barrel domain
MKKLQSLSIVAALGLANTVYAQAQTPQNPAEAQGQTTKDATAPGAASSPHQRNTTTTTSPESAPSGSTQPNAASSQHQRDATKKADASMKDSTTDKLEAEMVGMKVEMSTGENLGEVKEVLFDTRGDASYVVISHGGMMGIGSKRTAVPWATVKSVMREDKLIMDRSQLEQAPVLPRGKTQDTSKGTWSRDADAYWHAKVSTRSTDPTTGADGSTVLSTALPSPAKRY